MIELPEAVNLAQQISGALRGKRITSAIAQHTPHKLAWYYGEPAKYSELLISKTIVKADAYGGLVEIRVENANILFGDGVRIRFHKTGESRPPKHQLLVEFEDGSAVSASIQMYGGIGSFLDGTLENPYYKVAKEKPSPLSSAFDRSYFNRMLSPDVQKLSLKAFLATGQRIPGLGNGVLQDILFNAKMHPKRQVNTLTGNDRGIVFDSVKSTLSQMVAQGGRDTETDLFGRPGGYRTILCKNTVNTPCPVCGSTISKEAYMGGSIYYCAQCQML